MISRAPYLEASDGATKVATKARILVFGATSITGYALLRVGGERVVGVTSRAGVRRPRWRISDADDAEALERLLRIESPDTVIWAHAVCNVGKCEAHPQWAWRINVDGVGNLLRCLPKSTRLVYVSSDHVFGGDGSYTEKSLPAPISVYGRARAAAEALVLDRAGALVVRPGLAIGPSANGRSGFLDWLSYRYARGLPITVVGDEARSAMWADDLARRILALAASEVTGVRHIPGARVVTRPELATHLLRLRGLEPKFTVRSRHDQPAPHLGRIEIRSDYRDEHAEALPAVL